jgi:hypothetical protein
MLYSTPWPIVKEKKAISLSKKGVSLGLAICSSSEKNQQGRILSGPVPESEKYLSQAALNNSSPARFGALQQHELRITKRGFSEILCPSWGKDYQTPSLPRIALYIKRSISYIA